MRIFLFISELSLLRNISCFVIIVKFVWIFACSTAMTEIDCNRIFCWLTIMADCYCFFLNIIMVSCNDSEYPRKLFQKINFWYWPPTSLWYSPFGWKPPHAEYQKPPFLLPALKAQFNVALKSLSASKVENWAPLVRDWIDGFSVVPVIAPIERR